MSKQTEMDKRMVEYERAVGEARWLYEKVAIRAKNAYELNTMNKEEYDKAVQEARIVFEKTREEARKARNRGTLEEI